MEIDEELDYIGSACLRENFEVGRIWGGFDWSGVRPGLLDSSGIMKRVEIFKIWKKRPMEINWPIIKRRAWGEVESSLIGRRQLLRFNMCDIISV